MLKKFGYSLVVVCALMLGVCAINTVLVGSVMAGHGIFVSGHEEGNKCEKCGHVPTEPEDDCKCVCHAKKDVERKCEKCGHVPTEPERDCKCVCHKKKDN